jgi:hypothetical protein
VSTKDNKGSDSQIKVVVEQNNKSVLNDGTVYGLLVSSLLLLVEACAEGVTESTMSGSLSAAETEEHRNVSLSLLWLILLLREEDTYRLLYSGEC